MSIRVMIVIKQEVLRISRLSGNLVVPSLHCRKRKPVWWWVDRERRRWRWLTKSDQVLVKHRSKIQMRQRMKGLVTQQTSAWARLRDPNCGRPALHRCLALVHYEATLATNQVLKVTKQGNQINAVSPSREEARASAREIEKVDPTPTTPILPLVQEWLEVVRLGYLTMRASQLQPSNWGAGSPAWTSQLPARRAREAEVSTWATWQSQRPLAPRCNSSELRRLHMSRISWTSISSKTTVDLLSPRRISCSISMILTQSRIKRKRKLPVWPLECSIKSSGSKNSKSTPRLV